MKFFGSLILIMGILVLSGCSPSVTTTTFNGKCVSAAKYDENKQAQTIRNVSIKFNEKESIVVPETRDGKLYVEAPLLVEAPGGSTISIVTSRTNEANGMVKTTHFAVGTLWGDADLNAKGTLNGDQKETITAEIPGYFIASNPGCYQVAVYIDGTEYAPFAISIGRDEEAATVEPPTKN